MKTLGLIMLLLISFMSCQVNNLAGVYMNKEKESLITTTIILNVDSTFHYLKSGDLTYQETEGNYILESKNKISLKSYNKYKSICFQLTDSEYKDNAKIIIRLIKDKGVAIPYDSIIMKINKTPININTKGIVAYESEIKEISLEVVGNELTKQEFYFDDFDSGGINIKLKNGGCFINFFLDESYILERNRLIDIKTGKVLKKIQVNTKNGRITKKYEGYGL